MTLHIVKSASAEVQSLLNKAVSAEDTVMLIDEGVFLTPDQLPNQAHIVYRQTDMQSRGLSTIGFLCIDDDQWVELTIECQRTITWG